MMTQSITSIIKYVMNNQPIHLDALCAHYHKSQQYLRKEILIANNYLRPKYELSIKNSMVQSNISYNDYLTIMQSLTFDTYIPSQKERFDVILIKCYFEDYLNLTSLYNNWGLSVTTKKRDMKQLEVELNKFDLQIKRKPGSGIQITGDTLKYRIIIARILNFCIDAYDFHIERRAANSPIENDIYDTFAHHCFQNMKKSEQLIHTFLNEYQHDVSYYSKKFFIIYTLIALYQHPTRKLTISPLQLKPLNLYMFNDKLENNAFNQIAAMIDFNDMLSMPYNHDLMICIKIFFNNIVLELNTHFHTTQFVVEELYTYIYRQYFYNHFNFVYDDKLVESPKQKYPEIVHAIHHHKHFLEALLEFELSEIQITSMTLIIAKWISINQTHGQNAKRIVLVTNVSYERVNYFWETLSRSIELTLVKTIDINEIDLLPKLQFDLILSFSNRITTILKERGFNAVKLKFYIDHHDLDTLYKHGCQPAAHRIVAQHLVTHLDVDEKEHLTHQLKQKYPNLFI